MITVTISELAKGLQAMEDTALDEPITVGSWRGDYCDLGIGLHYARGGATTTRELAQLLVAAIGCPFEGYKGGEFKMDKDTEVHLADMGSSERSDAASWMLPIVAMALGKLK